MGKKVQILFFILSSLFSQSQTVRLSGNIQDTASKASVPNALLMAVRFGDSILVNYSRSNNNGILKPITVPRDTYLVILSHPGFSDKTYLLVPSEKDTAFTFKNVVMPPKSIS